LRIITLSDVEKRKFSRDCGFLEHIDPEVMPLQRSIGHLSLRDQEPDFESAAPEKVSDAEDALMIAYRLAYRV